MDSIWQNLDRIVIHFNRCVHLQKILNNLYLIVCTNASVYMLLLLYEVEHFCRKETWRWHHLSQWFCIIAWSVTNSENFFFIFVLKMFHVTLFYIFFCYSLCYCTDSTDYCLFYTHDHILNSQNFNLLISVHWEFFPTLEKII